MRGIALATMLALATASLPAEGKEFRHYFGMQWVVTPVIGAATTIAVKQGDTIAEAKLLTEDLFEISGPVIAAGKTIVARNAQLATAVSPLSVRCSISRGAPETLSYTRRICLTDDDRDGQFDHYFDVGLGQGGADVQFTGCIPNDRMAIEPVGMRAVDPGTLLDPMMFRVTLSKIHGKKVRSKSGQLLSVAKPAYEFGGSIGRNDRIWNYYSFCSQRGCQVPPQVEMDVKEEGISLVALRQEGDKAIVEIVRNLRKRNYWDMSRGKRPAPAYCPGTLFVKTDELTF